MEGRKDTKQTGRQTDMERMLGMTSQKTWKENKNAKEKRKAATQTGRQTDREAGRKGY